MGELNLEITKISADQQKEVGVFLSYARANEELVNEIIAYCGDEVNILSDKLLNAETQDFYNRINEMIAKSTCAVIVGDIYTPWTMFEIGRLISMHKNLYVFKGTKKSFLPNATYIDDLALLKEELKKNTLFSDLFEAESNLLTKEEFNKEVLGKLGYVSLKIAIPGIEKIPRYSYQFQFIVPQMYRQYITETNRVCYKNGEELDDCFCKFYMAHQHCPFIDLPKQTSKEIVILNKVYDNYSIDNYTVTYLIPVSNMYGVTFKCFVDIYDSMIKEQFIKLLQNAGLTDISISDSGTTNRVYFTLPKRQSKGLFKILEKEGFENNYICPGGLQ